MNLRKSFMKKRIVIILFAVMAILLLAACGKKDTAPTPAPSAPGTAKPTATPAPSLTPLPLQTPNPTPNQTPAPRPSPTRPPEVTETPMPLATLTPIASPMPSLTPLSASRGPKITKQPNGEAHNVGDSAVFVVAAEDWTALKWTAVSPSGREITIKRFLETFPDCSVTGENETTLTITNLNIDMSGWSFYCSFENEEGSSKTESARLRVTDPDRTTNGSASSSGSKKKALRCPDCGSEVPRDLLNCPYCGAEIYTKNKLAYVQQDGSGDIFYMDNTGMMYYNNSDRRSTYVDTNTNYAIFDDNGLVHYGNAKQEEEKEEEEALKNLWAAAYYTPKP